MVGIMRHPIIHIFLRPKIPIWFIYFLQLFRWQKNPLISSENAPQKMAKEVRAIVFNTTLNTISVISCRSVSFVEETGVPGENHGPVAIH
jgi:hypothetical protein